MASILKVDDLRGNTSAGNITITSEGGAATQSLQQGLTKAWINFDGTAATGTADLTGVADSFNVVSVVDNGTGNYTVGYTSNFSNADNCAVISINNTTQGTYYVMQVLNTISSSNVSMWNFGTSASYQGSGDPTVVTAQTTGDLA